jgi:hypothetical protein
MKLEYKNLIPDDMSAGSRVWIYQSNRRFTLSEALSLENTFQEFTSNWKSHGTPVKGFATLFFGQFIVLMADEEKTGVSGCSTDSSVRMIKSIESAYQVALFERTNLAFIVKDKIELLPLNQLQYAIEKGFLQSDTLFFDNSISTKGDLLTRWIVPMGSTLLGKRYQIQI